MTQEIKDPWLEEDFSQLDLRTGPEHFASQLADIANKDPESFPPPNEPPVVPPVTEPEPPQFAPAEVVQLENGAVITYVEDAKGWHAELDPGKGRPKEFFHARTVLDLMKQLAVGKVNSSIKINEQEKRLKTSVQKVDTPPVPPPPKSGINKLTADQVFEIKTLQASDPVAAFYKMCEMTTGVGWEEFVGWAKAGKEVKEKEQFQLTVNQVANKFRRLFPQYYNSAHNNEQMEVRLNEKNYAWTVENLIEVYQELSEGGFLEEAPKPQTPVAEAITPVTPVTPVPTDTTPRIERVAGRPSAAPAGFGLPQSASSARPPVQPGDRAPSVEELDNTSDEDINKLFNDVRRIKAQSARR